MGWGPNANNLEREAPFIILNSVAHSFLSGFVFKSFLGQGEVQSGHIICDDFTGALGVSCCAFKSLYECLNDG